MNLLRLATPMLLLGAFALPPAEAASFDCGKAETPFEKAICDTPDLSRADEILAKSFATATGGLTKASVNLMRTDQRNWLDFAQRACIDNAEPMTSGSYGEQETSCLIDVFKTRSTALEQSRMLGGHRFLVQGYYGALPDPNEAEDPDSYWKVARHELSYPLLDEDDSLAEAFNGYMSERVEGLKKSGNPEQGEGFDNSADTSHSVEVKEVAGTNRITLEATTYWFGHGAAHGNYTISYLHYYVPEEREVIASDLFTGADWSETLVDATWEQLQLQHGEWLMVEDKSDIAELVVDPTRWDISNDYGLVIQFQPYEVSAYAYGAPTVSIPWDKLDAIKAETQEAVRFGY